MQVKLLFTTFFRHYLVFYVFSTFCEPLGTSTITCMGAHFLGNSQIILGFFVISNIIKVKFLLVFVLASFSIVSSLFGVFWEASDALWAPFGIVWGLFGVLVSPFWVPVARLGCFWYLFGTFL